MIGLIIGGAVVAAHPPPLTPAVRATTRLGDYIEGFDYPIEAMMAREAGTVGFEVDVALDGSVTGCRITRSSGHDQLDRGTCEVVRERLRYVPARDASGHTVPDIARAEINWQLPSGLPHVAARARSNLTAYISSNDYPPRAMARGEQGRVAFELEINSEGRVTRCNILRSSGSTLLDVQTCRIMIVRSHFDPARDAAVNPTSDTLWASITWRCEGC